MHEPEFRLKGCEPRASRVQRSNAGAQLGGRRTNWSSCGGDGPLKVIESVPARRFMEFQGRQQAQMKCVGAAGDRSVKCCK